MQDGSMVTDDRTRSSARAGRPRDVRTLAVALVVALGLAACGGDDDAATTITSDADGITEVDGESVDPDAADPDEADPDEADPGEADTDAGDEAGEGDDAGGEDAAASPTGRQIPAAMPAAIPIPDDHLVLRSEDANYDHSGDFVGVNLAVSGTVEERRAYYRAALEEAYGEVEVAEPTAVTSEAFRFQGDWFELGEIYVDENEGYFDNDTIDTTGLPVIVTIQLSEIDDTSE